MKKRMLALALALCLLLAVLPVTAGATEGESANVGTFDELTEAINAEKKADYTDGGHYSYGCSYAAEWCDNRWRRAHAAGKDDRRDGAGRHAEGLCLFDLHNCVG